MDWLSDHATALTGLEGLATAVAAIVAIVTLIAAGRDSASRTRPYVIVEYRLPEFHISALYLCVRNIGSSPARNVVVTFVPPFEDGNASKRRSRHVAKRFEKPISMLGPGQELSSFVGFDEKDEAKSDVAPTLTATVTYDAPWWRLRRRYKDTFVLQRDVYAQQIFATTSNSVLGRLTTIAAQVTEVAQQQKGWERAFGEIARAAVDGPLLAANAPKAVAWRIRRTSDDVYLLENVGGESATNVELNAATEGMAGPALQGEGGDVAPRQSLEFFAAATMASGSPAITVAWSEESAGSTRRTETLDLP